MNQEHDTHVSQQTDFPYGARLTGPDTTQFRLWAPSADRVVIRTKDEPACAMKSMAGGWYEATLACGAGTQYRFEAECHGQDGCLSFPDPASHAQVDAVDGWSIVVDHQAYQWEHADWLGRPWHETVLYELHVGLHGGMRAMADILPELAMFGITAIELMPVAAFPGQRSWGYDGVLPFAPDAGYGTPEELKAFIDAAHGLGISVFLDVVYNHFGPKGNFLPAYAAEFFRKDLQTPWGDAIDFRRTEVRNFFTANAIHWLKNYRFDGLRFDAVHAISEPDWLREAAQVIRTSIGCESGPARHVHLVMENEDNAASLLGFPQDAFAFNAQWNDDFHNVMHVLLTGESEGYYKDYIEDPTGKLARSLGEGFIYQGQPAKNRDGKPRGENSTQLPSAAFVNFLQNHDQTGNRAFGERLTTLTEPRALKAAQALLLLTPFIPMLFMGEEYGSVTPFLFFTGYDDEELANSIKQGRREEFSRFQSFTDQEVIDSIPDPNDPGTYRASRPGKKGDHADAEQWAQWTRKLLQVRAAYITPGIQGASIIDTIVIAEGAVRAAWNLGNGTMLAVMCNLSGKDTRVESTISLPETIEEVIFDSGGVLQNVCDYVLPAYGFLASIRRAN